MKRKLASTANMCVLIQEASTVSMLLCRRSEGGIDLATPLKVAGIPPKASRNQIIQKAMRSLRVGLRMVMSRPLGFQSGLTTSKTGL